jgi:hypothetical protein
MTSNLEKIDRLEERISNLEILVIRLSATHSVPPTVPPFSIPRSSTLPLPPKSLQSFQSLPISPIVNSPPKIFKPLSPSVQIKDERPHLRPNSSSSYQEKRDELDDIFFSTTLAGSSKDDLSPLQKLLAPFSSLELSILESSFNEKADLREILCSVGEIDLRREDLLRLRPTQVLNDEIVNSWFKLITQGGLPKISAFSSFFFTKLQENGFSGVKKWSNVDIFALANLLIPVHITSHWVLININFESSEIGYFDSLSGIDFCSSLILQFLIKEHLWKKGTELDVGKWKIVPHQVPQQKNSFDCGVYICLFAHCIANKAKIAGFEQSNIPHLRQRIALELLSSPSPPNPTPNTRSKRSRKM